MSGFPERLADHRRATLDPVAPETDIVDLMRTITGMARRYGRDHLLREGVADLIEGASMLLHGDWGPRISTDEFRASLQVTAEQIGYDIDRERFANARPLDDDFRLELNR